ncbi:MAG: PKD domain-containing protein [Nitrospirae bacterium]|nr:PKD domain-containing protein [Nitrospirota bacterium]
MNRIFTHSLSVILCATVALLVDSSPGLAFPSFGPGVDTTCQAYNGTTPYADQGCALCHVNGTNPDKNLTPAGTLFKNNGDTATTAMCPVKNTAPVANAGPNQTATVGTTVTLNGTASSDIDGNLLTYQWSLTSIPTGSGATLANPTTAKPTFLADKPGQYIVQLIVNDGIVNSAPANVTISTANTAPVANAGPNQTVAVGATVTLNGSGSTDADGNTLTYQWSFASVPTGSAASLTLPTTMKPTFIVDHAGDYVVRLIVNDGTVNSAPATVTITTANTTPVANAGPDQTAIAGSTVTLNGSGSTDVDGNSLTYDWSFMSVPTGSLATFSNPTAAKPTFVADKAGQYVAQLIVNDGTVSSTPDTVTITTTGANTAPVANAGPDQTVSASSTVQLDGSASKDTDGNALRYQWALTVKPTGSKATLSNAATMMASFNADVAGQYVAQLTVNDGMVNSAPDTVMITTLGGNTAPVANAGPDQTVPLGTVVTLDGSASKDADGSSLTFQWTLTAKPLGSTAAISDPIAMRPTITVDVSGEYIAQLIVNDGTANSIPDTVIVKTTTPPPAPGVYISRSRWNASTNKLTAAGRAPKNASVEIRDAVSGTLLTTVAAGSTGRFRAYFTPPFVPCAIQATANGLLSEKTPVAGAPVNCGLTGGAPILQQNQEQEREDSTQQRQRRPSR